MRLSRLPYPDHVLFAKNAEMESEIAPNKWTTTNSNMQMRFNALIKLTIPRSCSVYQKYRNLKLDPSMRLDWGKGQYGTTMIWH